MRLFDDPLKTIVDGMVQAHGIRQQMLQARMEQARAKMMERDMAQREEDSQRSRQMQDIQFQQQMGDAARPVTGGVVMDDTGRIDTTLAGLPEAMQQDPTVVNHLRKADPSRLVKYKTADGQEMQYELRTPDEQRSRGLERLQAEQKAKAQAEIDRQVRLRQVLEPFEQGSAKFKADLEAQARKAQQDFMAGENEKSRGAQSAAQKATMSAADRRAQAANDTRLKAAQIAASRPRGGGGGAGANDQGLIDAVSANPALFASLTPTVRSRILPELARAGVNVGEKPMSASDSKVFSAAQTMLPQINRLMDEMKKPGFRARMAKVQIGWDPDGIGRLVDNVADQLGRLRSGGAVNKTEEERFRSQILQWADVAKGDNTGPLQGLQGIADEANKVISQMNQGRAGVSAPAGGAPQAKPAAGGGVPTVGGMFNGQKVLKVTRIE